MNADERGDDGAHGDLQALAGGIDHAGPDGGDLDALMRRGARDDFALGLALCTLLAAKHWIKELV